MLFLAGSVLFSTMLTVAFKVCQKLNINTFQAIVFNYFTCIIGGTVFGNSHPFDSSVASAKWLPMAIVLGCCFIVFFNITALTVKRSGVAVAGVATKISLVIPFLFSVYFFKEASGPLKWMGILLALLSVVLTCYVPRGTGERQKTALLFLLPVILFLGTGFQDAMIKFTEQEFLSPDKLDAFLVSCFIIAFSIGFLIMIYSILSRKIIFEWRAVAAGICIGIPNYLSIWCLVKVLKIYPGESSFVIPVNNVSILLLNVIAGYFFFREKLSAINIIGIILAVAAIFLITSNIT